MRARAHCVCCKERDGPVREQGEGGRVPVVGAPRTGGWADASRPEEAQRAVLLQGGLPSKEQGAESAVAGEAEVSWSRAGSAVAVEAEVSWSRAGSAGAVL